MKKKVLFLCTHNSARSQMAEDLLNNICGDKYEAYSAGSTPTKINPFSIQVLKDFGIDISKHYSKSTEQFMGAKFEYVITVVIMQKKCVLSFQVQKTMPIGILKIRRELKEQTTLR